MSKTDDLHWLPVPVCGQYENGRRWKLFRGSKLLGTVVQLLPNGYWEAYSEHYQLMLSPGHYTLNDAALALLEHVNNQPKKVETTK